MVLKLLTPIRALTNPPALTCTTVALCGQEPANACLCNPFHVYAAMSKHETSLTQAMCMHGVMMALQHAAEVDLACCVLACMLAASHQGKS